MGIKQKVKSFAHVLVGGNGADALGMLGPGLAGVGGQARADRIAELEGMLQERDAELRRGLTMGAVNAIRQSSESAFFRTIFNGVDVLLPRDTIKTMLHCVHGTQDGPVLIEVEEGHRKWMMSHLADGGVFLDVGSATGAMTIPVASTFGSKVAIIAFEPARKARGLLELTLARNGLLEGIEIVPKAISDFVGKASFCEYDYDESGSCPFLPEASAIHSPMIDEARVQKFDVEVTTLDTFCSGRTLPEGPVVIKVDVEGYEALVLQGAGKLISSRRPWFSIDIHLDPFGDGTTEMKVRDILAGYDYSFENRDHVLLASP